MGTGRFGKYVGRIHEELHSAFAQTYTPRELAGSFALGAFITMLPTFGTGLLVFVVIIALFDIVNKLALFASVLVFNPLVKWGVYVASFALGVLLLGPVADVSANSISWLAGPDIVLRLLIGNLILAVFAAVVSYVSVYQLAVRFEAAEIAEKLEEVLKENTDERHEPLPSVNEEIVGEEFTRRIRQAPLGTVPRMECGIQIPNPAAARIYPD